eukprot:6177536-Pleurochrysis_carterae.AAC.1
MRAAVAESKQMLQWQLFDAEWCLWQQVAGALSYIACAWAGRGGCCENYGGMHAVEHGTSPELLSSAFAVHACACAQDSLSWDRSGFCALLRCIHRTARPTPHFGGAQHAPRTDCSHDACERASYVQLHTQVRIK